MSSWQEQCTKELVRCVKLEATAPDTGRVEWERVRQTLASQKRIILADANLAKANLRGFNFFRCYMIRVILSRADLVNTKFCQAILRNCDLSYARLDRADLSLADLRGSKINFATPVEQINGVRPHLAEAIRNQQYRADLDNDSRGILLKIWNSATDYGNSLLRVFLISVILIVTFGITYYTFQTYGGMSVTTHHQSVGGMVAYAAETFLNAGIPYTGSNLLLRWLVIANVAFGFGALGVFIAILSRKLIAYVQ